MRVKGYQKASPSEVKVQTDEGNLFLYGISENSIRCVYTKREEPENVSPLEIPENTKQLGFAELNVEELENSLKLFTEELTLWIDKESGRFSWTKTADGTILLEEGEKELTDVPVMVYTTGGEKPVVRRVKTVYGERNFVENLRGVEDHKAYRAKLNFFWKLTSRSTDWDRAKRGSMITTGMCNIYISTICGSRSHS